LPADYSNGVGAQFRGGGAYHDLVYYSRLRDD
jgi:hypothetical protein